MPHARDCTPCAVSSSVVLTRSIILTYIHTSLRLCHSKRPICHKPRRVGAMSLSMDDRDGFIWLDGKLVPWRDSRMHVLTHALHYGSAVFEGERIYDGRVFRLAAHSQRLINSARLLDYEIPWTREQIEEATRSVVKANGLQSGYIRPIAWRGSEVMGVSGLGTSVHLAIAPWAQEGRLSVQARDSGIDVTMATYRRPSADFAPGHAKVAGLYIICGIEKDRALKAGFDDALMLDWKGDL